MNDSFQDQENKINSRVDDEISLKDILFKGQNWWGILLPKKNLIISLSILIGLLNSLNTKFFRNPTYTGSYQLFFQEDGGGLSNAMRLASSFGLGGVVNGYGSSSSTVQEFITSRNNIVHAMTEDLENGRLIDRYFAKDMQEDLQFTSIFKANFGLNQRYTDSTLTVIFYKLNKEFLSSVLDKETGSLRFDVTAKDETFALDLANGKKIAANIDTGTELVTKKNAKKYK